MSLAPDAPDDVVAVAIRFPTRDSSATVRAHFAPARLQLNVENCARTEVLDGGPTAAAASNVHLRKSDLLGLPRGSRSVPPSASEASGCKSCRDVRQVIFRRRDLGAQGGVTSTVAILRPASPISRSIRG